MKKTFLAFAIFTTASVVFSSCEIRGVAAYPNYGNDVAVGRPPGAGYVWINAEYAWRNGKYEQVPGYWAKPPHQGATWNKGRWQQGQGGKYQWKKGHWSR